MIRIAVCDDEELYCERIAAYCRQYFEWKTQEATVEYGLTTYASGEELLAEELPDILLLDIEMAGISGIQIKDHLQRRKTKTRILYITSHPEAMREAFGFQVFGFLEKPLDYDVFREKMDVAVEDVLASEREVCYTQCDIPARVKISDIRYASASAQYTYLHLVSGEEKQFSDQSLGWWEEMLAGEHFIRCHRSYLVNCAFIRRYEMGRMLLDNDEMVAMSRRRLAEVEEAYRAYIRDSAR